MRIAYLDCPSGISGDMTLGALVDAGVELARIQSGIDSLGLPGCRLAASEVKRHGFRATKVTVEHEPEDAHRHLHHITDKIDGSTLTPRQKELARAIFTKLAEAEAKVHGTTIRKVHFHEVGAVDSIADIVGAAIGFDLLQVGAISCAPVPTGHGYIQIAHGRCSVPAPATAELLRGIPLAPSVVESELTTPTGAAIVAALCSSFGPLPPMTIEQIGYGAGDRDFPQQANLLRLVVGQAASFAGSDLVEVLETNLDDVSGEIIGHCAEKLLGAGALDVYMTPIQMKKNRPATKLTVLCEAHRRWELETIIFRETGSLGIRRWTTARDKLDRETITVATQWGDVGGKAARLPSGEIVFAPEYEECRAVATSHDLPLRQVMQDAAAAFIKREG
jgi:uncharacterized protein (TIGR00299 family) protein